jgi:methyltransferase (TIGR00027 family)
VLNLGAGLDTRPYRLALPASLRWVEVDFPATISFKEARLSGRPAACRVERHGLDLSDRRARARLFEAIGAESRRTLVLTEGVLPYLHNTAVAELARDLHAQVTFASWIVDEVTRRFLLATRVMRHGRALRETPLRFSPGDWEGSFAAWGWAIGERCPLGYAGARLGRPLPLSAWLRPLFDRLPARVKHEVWTAGSYNRLDRAPSSSPTPR